MDAKCTCNSCGGHLEFDASLAGETIQCPHCGINTALFIPATLPDQPPKTEVAVPTAKNSRPWWVEPVVLGAIAIGLVFLGVFTQAVFSRAGFLIITFLALPCFAYAVVKAAWRMARLNPLLLLCVVLAIGLVGVGLWQVERMTFRAKFTPDGSSYFPSSKELDEEAQKAIVEKLVAPKTAVFESSALHWSGSRREGDHAYLRFTVDSQNQNGALVRSEWGVHVRHYGSGADAFWSVRDTIRLSGPSSVEK